jgi:hypothetical protein
VAPDHFSSVWNAAQPLPLRASRCARWMSHFSCGERGNVESLAAMSPATPSEMISGRGRIPRFVSPSRQSAPRATRGSRRWPSQPGRPTSSLGTLGGTRRGLHVTRMPASITARGGQMRELRPACPGLRGDEVAGTGAHHAPAPRPDFMRNSSSGPRPPAHAFATTHPFSNGRLASAKMAGRCFAT